MKSIGEKTQAIILAEFIKNDISVSEPFGDNQRYDYIVDINDKLYRVQVKTARLRSGTVTFRVNNFLGDETVRN